MKTEHIAAQKSILVRLIGERDAMIRKGPSPELNSLAGRISRLRESIRIAERTPMQPMKRGIGTALPSPDKARKLEADREASRKRAQMRHEASYSPIGRKGEQPPKPKGKARKVSSRPSKRRRNA